MMNRQISLISLLSGLMLVAIGCANQPHNEYVHGEISPPDDQPRQLDKVLDAQAASGASLDATLHAVHFDGDMLNTLGQEKLDLMLRSEHVSSPMVVYVELPKDDPQLDKRTNSVALFLKDRGLSDDQFTIKIGPNTAYSSPAADSVRELRVLDAGAAPQASGGNSGGSYSGGQ